MSAGAIPCLNARLDGSTWVEIGDGFWIPPLVVAGCQPEAYAVAVHGPFHGFYVAFEPVGPLALLGMRHYWRGGTDPPAFADTVRPRLAPAARRYADAVVGAADFDERAALTVAFLLDALASASPTDLAAAAFLQEVVDALERSGGAVRVAPLAETLGVSASTLRRRFAVLGMPAKRYAEIARFRQAHAYLHGAPETTMADVALQFGFADQAHFARDYRRFSGTPPTRWLHDARIMDRRMGIEGRFDPDSDPAG